MLVPATPNTNAGTTAVFGAFVESGLLVTSPVLVICCWSGETVSSPEYSRAIKALLPPNVPVTVTVGVVPPVIFLAYQRVKLTLLRDGGLSVTSYIFV